MASLEDAFSVVQSYLFGDSGHPFIIDIQTRTDLRRFNDRFRIGSYIFLSSDEFTTPEGLLILEDLYRRIGSTESPVFITGLSSIYKLMGEKYLKSSLKNFLYLDISNHLIIITYQCSKYLNFGDPRLSKRVFVVDGEPDPATSLFFIKGNLSKEPSFVGLSHMEKMVEGSDSASCYVITRKTVDDFKDSLLYLRSLSAYDLLCSSVPDIRFISKDIGTEELWEYAYSSYLETGSWESLFDRRFGSYAALSSFMNRIGNLDDKNRWLFFIGLKSSDTISNSYVRNAVSRSSSPADLVDHIYNDILDLDHLDAAFGEVYSYRKHVVREIGDDRALFSFCDKLKLKQSDSIFYLTDNTRYERELLFEIINDYRESYPKDVLLDILRIIYPDLYHYLDLYQFREDLLTDYFSDYKYLKIVNTTTEKFLKKVNEQSVSHDFLSLLSPRTSVFETIDRNSSLLFFIDALGVEYLSFILYECDSLGLSPKVRICRCELPSITACNTEFREYFKNEDVRDPKDLDDIKHDGIRNMDYQKVKLPIHLTEELIILKRMFERIASELHSGLYKKVIVVSDHGASRLAVIHESENKVEMGPESKGKHSGRCCLKTEVDEKPDYVIDGGDYWVLCNYDRFKGSRKADVEVHGGATLEEVTVPLIEVTLSDPKIELRLISSDGEEEGLPVITVSFKKKGSFDIISSRPLDSPYVSINGKYYAASELSHCCYHVDIPDLKKAGKYRVIVYSSGVIIDADMDIIIRKESGGERVLL